MLKWILAALIGIPLVELILLIVLGNALGFWPTILVLLVMGIIGSALAKMEGGRVWREWREALAEGRTPEAGVLDGLLVLVAGILMITPGVLTDVMGLALMIRPVRRRVAAFVRTRLERAMDNGTLQVSVMGFGVTPRGPAAPGGPRRIGDDRPPRPLRDIADAELVD